MGIGLFVLILSSKFASGQINLVLNPSFEDTIPNYDGNYLLEKMVTKWWCAQISPDYYSRYYSLAYPFVPNTVIGYQQPRTGDGFSGEAFYVYGGHNFEYVGGNLKAPLLAGKLYCGQFYICRAYGTIWSDVSSDSFGMYCTSDSIVSSGGDQLPFVPQIQNPTGNIIYDTLNWIPISGQFTAKGGEKYLIIGNFKSTQETQLAGTNGGTSYYFIDDVAVWLCDPDTITSVHPEINNELQTVFFFSDKCSYRFNTWHRGFFDYTFASFRPCTSLLGIHQSAEGYVSFSLQ